MVFVALIHLGCSVTPKNVIHGKYKKGDTILFLAYHDSSDFFVSSGSAPTKRVLDYFHVVDYQFENDFDAARFERKGRATRTVRTPYVMFDAYGIAHPVYNQYEVGFETALREAGYGEREIKTIKAFPGLRQLPYFALLDHKKNILREGPYSDEQDLTSKLEAFLRSNSR